jgi:TonB family protein
LSGTPWSRWIWSLAINGGALLALIAVPVTVYRVSPPQSRVATLSLTAPIHSAPPRPNPRPVPLPVPTPLPHVEFHAPVIKPPETRSIAVEAPAVVVPPPVLASGLEAAKIDLPPRPAIKAEVFAANSVAPMSQVVSAKPIKTGGFGDPNGVPPAASSSNRPATVQNAGSFDLPSGQGSGPARAKGVASAGFGSPAAVGVGAPVRGAVPADAGFGEFAVPARGVPVARTAAPVETPVEITFKPKPLYTPEARDKKIEGEVQLEVSFDSSGQIHVLRVLHGLGFGLDENARIAAGQIRFRPATRNGSPVDVTGIVHIVFELS